jgi:hypothetical protein
VTLLPLLTKLQMDSEYNNSAPHIMDNDNITNSDEYKAMLRHKGIEAPVAPTATASTAATSVAKVVKQPTVLREPPRIVEEIIKVPTTPLWPVEPEQIEIWKAERAVIDSKIVAHLKEIESPSHIELVIAAAREAAQKKMAMAPRAKVYDEPKEVTAKTPKVKKESRQTRLGQTKLIDDLLKAGKTEKEVFDTVREKIPAYPADKLPKLIKLRQYHVKK